MKSPIAEAEGRAQWQYVERLLDAEPTMRKPVLIDAMLLFGHRFGYTLKYCADVTGHAEPFDQLLDEFGNLMALWIDGKRFTTRADEDERRAAAVIAAAEEDPRLAGLAARAIVALPRGSPQRDVDRARRLLETCEAALAEKPSGESKQLEMLLALAVRIRLDEPEEADLVERVGRGLALEADVNDPGTTRMFRVAASGRYVELAIMARDANDGDRARRLAERGIALLEDLDPDDGIVVTLGTLSTFLDDRRAAETFRRLLDDPKAGPEIKRVAAWMEAKSRYKLGEHDRVVEVLAPRLAAYEAQYFTAVAREDVENKGGMFGEVTMQLAFSHAYCGNWRDAVAVLDRGKSRRARYRAALRSAPEGAEILERERELYELDRGAGYRPPVLPDAHVDPLVTGVSPRTSLLEAYRRLSPRLEQNGLSTPSLAEIASVLANDEAALILGLHYETAMVVGVRSDDTAAPSIARFVPLAVGRLVEVLAPGEGYGWLTARRAGAGRAEAEAELRRLLHVVDELVRPTAAELHAAGIRRLVVVPHRLLHLVPFWAVPSLSRFTVETAPSAAAVVSARGRPVASLGSQAAVVANPTGDLRIASAEADAVERHLTTLGIHSRRLTRAAATETAVLEALAERPGILHFCGHGQSDLMHPEVSALLICPDPQLAGAAEDPFVAWTSAVAEWRNDGGMRWGDVPGLGRVIEERTEQGLERRLEYGAHGTLWTRYQDDRRIAVAELWSAGEMLVARDLDGCALAVLSACESGLGALGGGELDEAAGLPAAVQLAGAANVVATLWPVGDAESALFVDELYGELARCSGVADLVAIVHTVRERLREMSREAAVDRAAELRARTTDSVGRFALERFIRDLRGGVKRPFGEPYAWAPFFVCGTGKVMIEEVP